MVDLFNIQRHCWSKNMTACTDIKKQDVKSNVRWMKCLKATERMKWGKIEQLMTQGTTTSVKTWVFYCYQWNWNTEIYWQFQCWQKHQGECEDSLRVLRFWLTHPISSINISSLWQPKPLWYVVIYSVMQVEKMDNCYMAETRKSSGKDLVMFTSLQARCVYDKAET